MRPARTDNGAEPLGDAKRDLFPIVGIGASAGGIEAFRTLLRNLPADTGMAFIYIQHLDPAHKSILADIFSRDTTMRVVEAVAGIHVEPDTVYIIPPNTTMTLSDGVLALARRTLPPVYHLPIDEFLRSLAEAHPLRGIAVVLSGASSDGALGLAAVKQSGGITFAQDNSAPHVTMPHHAINTGCVEFVMPPDAIAAELARIARHPYFLGTGKDVPEAFPEGSEAAAHYTQNPERSGENGFLRLSNDYAETQNCTANVGLAGGPPRRLSHNPKK